jgi:hypothetical protein
MALATLGTTVARSVTDKRIITDVIRSFGVIGHWWSPVAGMAYADPATGFTRIRPRIGTVDQISTGVQPFAATGFKPATFANIADEPRLRAALPGISANILSFFAIGNSAENFTEIMGLRWTGVSLGLRILHNNVPAISTGASVLLRNTAVGATAIGSPYLLAGVVDLANNQAALSLNGGAFVAGAITAGSIPAPAAQEVTVDIGAQILPNGSADRFNGWIGDVGVAFGQDLRNQPALMAELHAYAQIIWGTA